MEKNIAMQITREENPDEARFRKGDFLIGTEGTLNLLKNHSSVLSDKWYTIENATIEQVKQSNDVKYHYVLRETHYDFTFVTIHKEVALKHLNHKKRIPIKYHDERILETLIDKEEQLYFLNDVAKYESECVLNGDWVIWTETNYKLPQINYFNNLTSDHERQIYADAIGQQYALNLLLGPISVITDSYDLGCINTFFKNIEFYFDNNNTIFKNDEKEYVTSLRIKELSGRKITVYEEIPSFGYPDYRRKIIKELRKEATVILSQTLPQNQKPEDPEFKRISINWINL